MMKRYIRKEEKGGRKRGKKDEEINSSVEVAAVDRLSRLPDNLLLEILSLMPLKSAVATSILSRHWRFLWTNLQDIHLLMDDDFADLRGLNLIRNNLLPKFNSPFIRKFSLDLGFFNHRYNGIANDRNRISSHVLECFHRACNKNNQLQEFSFNIDGQVHYDYDVFPDLPLSVFQIPSLVVLRLNPWLSVHQDDNQITNAVFNLPNLKTLDVVFFTFHTTLLENLVSSSPSLAHLSFKLRVPRVDTPILSLFTLNFDTPILSPFTLNLSHPTLNRLDIRLSDAVHVTIDAPNLHQLGLTVSGLDRHFLNRVSFVNSPTRLVACSIHVSHRPIDQLFLPSNLFSIISTVKSLSVYDKEPCSFIAPITFSRLTHLGLLLDWTLAGLPLLQQCPVLEVLTFDLTHILTSVSLCPWPLPDSPPQCLVYSVKRIEILLHAFVDGIENPLLHLLKYLLANAKALELLKVTVARPDLSEFKNASWSECFSECHFIKELLDTPRSSAHCQFKFYGLEPTVLGVAIDSDTSLTSPLDSSKISLQSCVLA